MQKLVTQLACLTITLNFHLAVAQTPDITVDFSKRVSSPKSMFGILHGANATTPGNLLITALKPGLWRSGKEATDDPDNTVIAARARSLGIPYTVVCSDSWFAAPTDGGPWAQAPYNPGGPATNYYQKMQELAQKTIDPQTGAHLPVFFDIWNEPNTPQFFYGTREQFFNTFQRAYNAIKSVRSDAIIVGPSISGYDKGFLDAFMDFAKANQMVIDCLSWHEYRHGSQLVNIHGDLQTARQNYIAGGNSPKYDSVGVKEIHINEGVTQSEYLDPASILSYMSELERGGADRAARSGWDDDHNETLGGLLVPGTANRRSAWWAGAMYADTFSSRVESVVTGQYLFVLANAPDAGNRRVLLGQYRNDLLYANIPVISASVKFVGLPERFGLPTASYKIFQKRLNNSGEAEASEPTQQQVDLNGDGVANDSDFVVNGSVIQVPNLKVGTVVQLELQKIP